MINPRPSGGSEFYDGAVLGGGPAGIAAAAGLAKQGRRVVVLERSRYEGPRFGETLGPEVEPLLSAIGAWQSFEQTRRIPFRAIFSAWGSHELVERSSILHPLGEGWHVDRAEVDRCLAEGACSLGVEVRTGVGFCAVSRQVSTWRIEAAGKVIDARFLIDASGRGGPALASVLPERQWRKADRLIAISVRFGPRPFDAAGELLLESAEEGWWYSVPQPDGGLLVTLMTDADLLPAGGRAALESNWMAALAKTIYTASRASGYGAAEPVRTTRSESGFMDPCEGNGWIAAGDAAMAWDPLSGSGYTRALRSGFEAAERVEQTWNGQSGSTEERDTVDRFGAYLERRDRYYSIEKRWEESAFWQRRRPA
jgi:flavin-dependent dehydrogenase